MWIDKVVKLSANRFQMVRVLAYYSLARHLPDSTVPGGAVFRWLRYMTCRKLFANCGVQVNIERGAYIGCSRDISIGDRSGIGIRSWIGRGTRIGSDVMMSPEVMVFTQNHQTKRTDISMMDQGMDSYRPVTIGDDVWIGARAILLPGVTVHSHSVIGAGSVVTKDVPQDVIVAGNPASIVRHRGAKRAIVLPEPLCKLASM